MHCAGGVHMCDCAQKRPALPWEGADPAPTPKACGEWRGAQQPHLRSRCSSDHPRSATVWARTAKDRS